MTARLLYPCLIAVFAITSLAACDGLTDPGVSPDPEDPVPETRSVEGVPSGVAAIVGTFAAGPVDQAFLLESWSEFEVYYGGLHLNHVASLHVRAFFENGGEEIWVARADNPSFHGLIGRESDGTGMFSLDDANRFNTLLIPELFSMEEFADRHYAAADAIDYATERDAMMLLDPPFGANSAFDMIEWVNHAEVDLRQSHAAAYFGRIQVEEYEGADEAHWIGASGAAAGLFAWSDREHGVWSVPAGNDAIVVGAVNMSPLANHEIENMVQNGINPLNFSSDNQIVLWGGRTLSDTEEFRYLNVQRLTLHLDALIRDELAWTAGETSEPALWDAAREAAEDVLHELWLDGAFQGSSANEAYFVQSNEQTHTNEDIEEGRLNLEVGYAAQRAAEFYIRHITIEL